MKPRSPSPILLISCTLAASVIALGGCGQRGPLRLPVIPPEIAAPSATAKPAPDTPPAAVQAAPK